MTAAEFLLLEERYLNRPPARTAVGERARVALLVERLLAEVPSGQWPDVLAALGVPMPATGSLPWRSVPLDTIALAKVFRDLRWQRLGPVLCARFEEEERSLRLGADAAARHPVHSHRTGHRGWVRNGARSKGV